MKRFLTTGLAGFLLSGGAFAATLNPQTATLNDFLSYAAKQAVDIEVAAKEKNRLLLSNLYDETNKVRCQMNGRPASGRDWTVSSVDSAFGIRLRLTTMVDSRKALVTIAIDEGAAKESGIFPALTKLKAGDKVPFSGVIEVDKPCESIGQIPGFFSFELRDATLDLAAYGATGAQKITSSEDIRTAKKNRLQAICQADSSRDLAIKSAREAAVGFASRMRYSTKKRNFGKTVFEISGERYKGQNIVMLSKDEVDRLLLKPDRIEAGLYARDINQQQGECNYYVDFIAGDLKMQSRSFVRAKIDEKTNAESVTVSANTNFMLLTLGPKEYPFR